MSKNTVHHHRHTSPYFLISLLGASIRLLAKTIAGEVVDIFLLAGCNVHQLPGKNIDKMLFGIREPKLLQLTQNFAMLAISKNDDS